MAPFCPNCGKDIPVPFRVKCTHCWHGLDKGGNASETLYCNDTCLQAHKEAHQIECNAMNGRKILYRVGRTSQKCFFEYRAAEFDRPVEGIHHSSDCLLIAEGPMGNEELFRKLPTGHATKIQIRQILSFGVGPSEFIERFSWLIAAALEDHAVEIFVGTMATPTSMQKVSIFVIEDPETTGREPVLHRYMRIVLRDCESYILDLTKHAVGIRHTVSHLSTMPAAWHGAPKQEVEWTKFFGMHQTVMEKKATRDRWYWADQRGCEVRLGCQMEVTYPLKKFINDWLKGCRFQSMKEFFDSPPTEFRGLEEIFIEETAQHVESLVLALKNKYSQPSEFHGDRIDPKTGKTTWGFLGGQQFTEYLFAAESKEGEPKTG